MICKTVCAHNVHSDSVVSALLLSKSSNYEALWATQGHGVNAAITTANKQQQLPEISCHVAVVESKSIFAKDKNKCKAPTSVSVPLSVMTTHHTALHYLNALTN